MGSGEYCYMTLLTRHKTKDSPYFQMKIIILRGVKFPEGGAAAPVAPPWIRPCSCPPTSCSSPSCSPPSCPPTSCPSPSCSPPSCPPTSCPSPSCSPPSCPPTSCPSPLCSPPSCPTPLRCEVRTVRTFKDGCTFKIGP